MNTQKKYKENFKGQWSKTLLMMMMMMMICVALCASCEPDLFPLTPITVDTNIVPAPDTSSPQPLIINPANGATGVPINRVITSRFSEGMQLSSINLFTFTLTGPGATPVVGTVNLDITKRIATFTPGSDLQTMTKYTATITTGAEDLSGNSLTSDYIWEFTTGALSDLTAPTVRLTAPADGDTEVALNRVLTARFSENINPLSINLLTYTLQDAEGDFVAGSVAIDGATRAATFMPNSSLAINTIYTATLTTQVTDLAGNTLANDYEWVFETGIDEAQTVLQVAVPLGSASNFAVLASAAITNIPTSMIRGAVGLTPDTGANISGFIDPATCPEIIGTMYSVDATGPACAVIDPTILLNAKDDAEIAFNNARAAVRGTPQAISGNLNGLTLYPGLYESSSSLEISSAGFLYLDAQGNSNAIFIIRSATSITTEATSEVVLTKGAKAANIYWIAGSAITLGTNSIMKGTLIAGSSLSLLTGADLEGRALNQGAAAEAITLDSSTITVPAP